MTKSYYVILEISENVAQEEIKKNYRKLALKWHPDRWIGKSEAEKKTAEEKFKEINEAYEVLGDEEKRRRYDAGETNFTSFTSEYSYEEELKKTEEKFKEALFEAKILARREAVNIVGFEMLINEVYPSKLDSKLWEPYNNWQEKVWKVEIREIKDSQGKSEIDTSELDKFKETMISAIRKRKEELKAGINNPYVDKTRKQAIESIERELANKNLTSKGLDEKYQNYKEEVNNLPKVWQINAFRDRVIDNIWQKSRKNNYRTRKFNEDVNAEKKDTERVSNLETNELTAQEESSQKQEVIKGQGNEAFWILEKLKQKQLEIQRQQKASQQNQKQSNSVDDNVQGISESLPSGNLIEKQTLQNQEVNNQQLRQEIESLRKQLNNLQKEDNGQSLKINSHYQFNNNKTLMIAGLVIGAVVVCGIAYWVFLKKKE